MDSKFVIPKGISLAGLEKQEDSLSNEKESEIFFNKHKNKPIAFQRQNLPIAQYRKNILYAVKTSRVTIVVGETGCGKSTQIPQYLYESGWCEKGRVIVCLPRRMTVLNMTSRIAEEKQWTPGSEIGYKMRFDSLLTEQTRIQLVTHGMFVRELIRDPLLSDYSIVMIDEAHERTLNCDIMMMMLKKVLRVRSDLKLIITSATINANEFTDFFSGVSSQNNSSEDEKLKDSCIVQIIGRQNDVEIFHSNVPVRDYVDSALEAVLKIHKSESIQNGDILVFLPAVKDIMCLVNSIHKLKVAKSLKISAIPLFSTQNTRDQLFAFLPDSNGCRKVVISTNIAETSLTIPGITYVVDCGFIREKVLDLSLGLEILTTLPISKASACQRAGRAGRERPGKAYRLYTKEDFNKMEEYTLPEMQKANLMQFILISKLIGIENFQKVDMITKPGTKNLKFSLESLYILGAIDDTAEINEEVALAMADLPVHPYFARAIIESCKLGCIKECIAIAAICQLRSIFVFGANSTKKKLAEAKKYFAVNEGDHLTFLNILTVYAETKQKDSFCQKYSLNKQSLDYALQIQDQLSTIISKYKNLTGQSDNQGDTNAKYNVSSILKSLCRGFCLNLAQYHPSGCYKILKSRSTDAHLHPESVLNFSKPPKYVLFTDLIHTDKIYMKDVSSIQEHWIKECVGNLYEMKAHF